MYDYRVKVNAQLYYREIMSNITKRITLQFFSRSLIILSRCLYRNAMFILQKFSEA